MAMAILEVAAELGIDVPGELSVIGFDNIPESALADPPLTTVQQPIRQMGHDADRHAHRAHRGRDPPTAPHPRHRAGAAPFHRVPGGTSS